MSGWGWVCPACKGLQFIAPAEGACCGPLIAGLMVGMCQGAKKQGVKASDPWGDDPSGASTRAGTRRWDITPRRDASLCSSFGMSRLARLPALCMGTFACPPVLAEGLELVHKLVHHVPQPQVGQQHVEVAVQDHCRGTRTSPISGWAGQRPEHRGSTPNRARCELCRAHVSCASPENSSR